MKFVAKRMETQTKKKKKKEKQLKICFTFIEFHYKVFSFVCRCHYPTSISKKKKFIFFLFPFSHLFPSSLFFSHSDTSDSVLIPLQTTTATTTTSASILFSNQKKATFIKIEKKCWKAIVLFGFLRLFLPSCSFLDRPRSPAPQRIIA